MNSYDSNDIESGNSRLYSCLLTAPQIVSGTQVHLARTEWSTWLELQISRTLCGFSKHGLSCLCVVVLVVTGA